MIAQPRPTPTQRAVLEELARHQPAGTYACIELEINVQEREFGPRLAVKNGSSRYLEDRPVGISTVRLLRTASWIEETKRWTTSQVTRGRRQWHREHVEYAITAEGRTAIAPRRKR